MNQIEFDSGILSFIDANSGFRLALDESNLAVEWEELFMSFGWLSFLLNLLPRYGFLSPEWSSKIKMVIAECLFEVHNLYNSLHDSGAACLHKGNSSCNDYRTSLSKNR